MQKNAEIDFVSKTTDQIFNAITATTICIIIPAAILILLY